MKYFRVILATAILSFAFLLSSCEKDEMEISGDSGLRVENECSVDAEIYFDGDYIGDVESEKTRNWEVPSGTHKVKADCSYKGEVEKSYNFPAGNIVLFTLSD